MKVMGIVGWSGSGKTTLIVRLLPELVRRGLRVSTMKHAHHAFDVDKPGKDSFEHRAAGATEVLVSSANRWALMHEHRGDPEATAAALVARMTPVDLLLIEGFKHEPHPKIEVRRSEVAEPPLWRDDDSIVAVAADPATAAAEGAELRLPLLPLDDVPAIADFILARLGLTGR